MEAAPVAAFGVGFFVSSEVRMDWKLFLKELIADPDTKAALGLILSAAVILIPGVTLELRGAIVVLIFGVVKVWTGAQSAKFLHDLELEDRAQLAKKANEAKQP